MGGLPRGGEPTGLLGRKEALLPTGDGGRTLRFAQDGRGEEDGKLQIVSRRGDPSSRPM